MNFKTLLDELDDALEKGAKTLQKKLQEILENGGDINGAFASFTNDFWADFLKAYNKANGAELSLGELMNLRIDKISLSDALYTGLKESKNAAKSVIKTAIKEQKSANELAKMLYEGYDFKADPLKVKTKFPKYLWEKSAKTKVKNIKTPALRAAYSKLLKDESKLASNKALKIAGYEKARYNAKRIALNETARAYNDARAFEYANSNDIQAVKIQMSKTHPRTDICDYYASVDKYGLGAGVYPKHKAPVPPFHPFCRCQMIPLYADEYSKAKLNANADKEYLLSLKEWQRARILGSKAKADEAIKTGNINSVFNAMKPGRYKVKSISEVAEIDKIIKDLTNATISQKLNFINELFNTKTKKSAILLKSDIFGSEKNIILSSATVQSHLHHLEITANEYAKIKDILGQKLHAYNPKTDTRKMAIFAIYNKDIFKIILKDIPNQNEIYIVSMIKLSSNFKKLKKEISRENKRCSKLARQGK